MKKQPCIFSAIIASAFSVSSHASNNNPSTVEYVQSQIATVTSYVQLQIGDVLNYVKSQVSNIPVVSTYNIGQQALGGTVFYVDSKGTHGLVAAKSTSGIASNQTWDGGISSLTSDGSDIITNATGNGIGAGAINTLIMVSVQSGYVALSSPIYSPQTNSLTNMAAQVCVNFSIQADGETACTTDTTGASCYADWYLPSLYELDQMYLQKSTLNYPITQGQDAFIWSSTESDQNNAYRINFTASSGSQQGSTSKSDSSGVWCVRAF